MNQMFDGQSSPVPSPWYYRVLIRIAKPLYEKKVQKKSAKLPTLARELDERFAGIYGARPDGQGDQDDAPKKGLIWCHAVSLGELNTAHPLLSHLLDQGFDLWITSTTQTGFARADALFGKSPRVNHSFVPVDSTQVVRRFLRHVRPCAALFIETELWATTLYELAKVDIPSILVNARLTQKSFDGYRRFGALSRGMMHNLSAIIAQDAISQARFISLGADSAKVTVCHSLKWASVPKSPTDATSPKIYQALTDQAQTASLMHTPRPIWVMASTHAGEESLALAVQGALIKKISDALLILVPRHPERFDEVARLCQDSGLVIARRSQGDVIDASTQVYLADSMGELLIWYQICNVAVVGGSFVDVGGHNPIEPAHFGKPVIMGSFVKNCELIVHELGDAQALVQATDQAELLETLCAWLGDPTLAQAKGQQGRQLVADRQHAHLLQAAQVMAVLGGRCDAQIPNPNPNSNSSPNPDSIQKYPS